MADKTEDDIATYVEAAAALLALPIPGPYRAAVIANFERSRQIAGLALAQPLDDDLMSGPVFRP